MQRGFPLGLLGYVRCSVDAGMLEPARDAGPFVVAGTVRCATCGAAHRIEDGILSLLASNRLHPESAREMEARDAKNAAILAGAQAEWSSPIVDDIEVVPTLDAVGPTDDLTVLELGCGAGRYTLALAARAAAVVAVDFSRPGLLVLREKLDPDAPVALVQADVTKPYAAPDTFDRVLSTLHSNLPDARERMAALAQVAQAMRTTGRAVISMHHMSGRDRLRGVAAAGRYPDSGIFRYYMSRSEAQRESEPFFARVRFVHISAGVPGVPSASVARLAARLPLARSALARLFLAVSELPRRDTRRTGIDAALDRAQVKAS